MRESRTRARRVNDRPIARRMQCNCIRFDPFASFKVTLIFAEREKAVLRTVGAREGVEKYYSETDCLRNCVAVPQRPAARAFPWQTSGN